MKGVESSFELGYVILNEVNLLAWEGGVWVQRLSQEWLIQGCLGSVIKHLSRREALLRELELLLR